MLRAFENCRHAALLDHFSGIHHGHALRHFGHYGQIVRDEHQRHALLLLQAQQQIHDLRLNGHVQRRGGFVGNQQFRGAGECHGDHDALTHAAGELVRVSRQARGGSGNFHQFHQLQRTPLQGSSAQTLMNFEHLHDLIAHRVARIERGHRILEDHGNVLADDLAALPGRQLQQRLAVEVKRVGGDACLCVEQTHDGHHRDRFARPRFAHDAQHLARVHRQAHAFNRMEATLCGAECNGQIFYFKQGHADASLFMRHV